MTVGELIRRLREYPESKEVSITVELNNEAVLEIVSLAMAHGQEPLVLSAEPYPDLQVVPCECQDPTHDRVSIEVCGLCLAGIDHDSEENPHFEGTD